MDCFKWTPNKNKMSCENVVMLSPITKTPVQQNDIKIKRSFQNSTSSFSLLPNHITPPSGLSKFIARNPFEADLTSKLHISVISPSVFTKVASPAQKGSPGFTWSIDELALIQPAKIDEFPIQQMHCSDPEIERTAQEAISKFFSENHIIPSPHDAKRYNIQKEIEMQTPSRILDDVNVSRESYKTRKSKKDCWTQTILSLPPELPAEVEEALKPYFNFTQDQNCDNEEANTSNSSLRRKLFTNNDDSLDDSNSSILISPVKSNVTVHSLSPPQSGIFFHGTPLRNCSEIIQRTYGTPRSRNSSPCSVSPIGTPGLNMSCQSINSRNKSVIKLDFTKDMSIEVSLEDQKNRKTPINDDICKTLFSEDIKVLENETVHYEEDMKCNDITQMVISNDNSIKLHCENTENFVPNNFNISEKSKFTEIYKTHFSESYTMQQSNMLSGNYAHQMGLSTAQDTGYQTHSSSNITSTMDSYSSSNKLKLHWDERVAQIEDEVQLIDWKENMKNVISSTPSKFNRGISNR